MMVDIANLEWWQTLVAIIGVLGLSPAPWLLGMAFNRIQFSAPARASYDERVADLKSAHSVALQTQSVTHVAAIAELVKHHADLVAVKDAAYAELRESRDVYKTAAAIERERADKVTDQLAELGELAKLTVHALDAITEAAKDAAP
jgi:hypothetical protein